jgi:hypothetical protein
MAVIRLHDETRQRRNNEVRSQVVRGFVFHDKLIGSDHGYS